MMSPVVLPGVGLLACPEGILGGLASRSIEGPGVVSGVEEWDVLFPHQLVGSSWIEGAVSLHEAASHRSQRMSRELAFRNEFLHVCPGVLKELQAAEIEREFWEAFLFHVQAPVMVRALGVEVPLGESEPSAAEQFLQTRTIGLEEARGELEKWVDPGKDEIRALEETTHAVERVSAQDVEALIKGGTKVVQVPGKVVLTRKSGVGKRRLRAVCCGNFIPPSELNTTRSELYAGGVDSLTVRVVLAHVSQFPSWCGCAVDVKTAFLNAPVRGSQPGEEGSAPVIIVKPPYFLTQLGLMQPGDRWRVRKALYGLQTSPRDWAEHRDKALSTMSITSPVRASLFQSVTDNSLWHVKDQVGSLVAVMIVYVDDVAAFGPEGVVRSLVGEVGKRWTLSEPTWSLNQQVVMFCGMELKQFDWGWRVSQERYLTELLNRYNIHGVAAAPILKMEEPEEETPSPERVKEAQGITGAVLWATSRSRPDLMFVTNLMSRYATRAPSQVVQWGMQALKYVASTLDLGLEYRRDPGPLFGLKDQLSSPRDCKSLEVYSDASHAPAGNRSMQCTVILWRGCLLLWESSRQAFTTLSSAEAELVSMMYSVQAGESVSPIVEEFVEGDLGISLLGDNAAALTAFQPQAGSWRSRHLRMRAIAGRERIEAGSLTVNYVPGELQVADIGTKPLTSGKMLGLLDLVNVRRAKRDEAGPVAAKFFGRLISATAEVAERVSPATIVALAVLRQSVPTQAAEVRGFTLVSSTWVMVVAQPQEFRSMERSILSRFFGCVGFGLFYGVLLGLFGRFGFFCAKGLGRHRYPSLRSGVGMS